MDKQLKSWLRSSQDPAKVSERVRGLVLSLSGLIIFFAAQFFHIQMTATDVLALATEISIVAGAVITIKGALMKLVIHFGTVKDPGA